MISRPQFNGMAGLREQKVRGFHAKNAKAARETSNIEHRTLNAEHRILNPGPGRRCTVNHKTVNRKRPTAMQLAWGIHLLLHFAIGS